LHFSYYERSSKKKTEKKNESQSGIEISIPIEARNDKKPLPLYCRLLKIFNGLLLSNNVVIDLGFFSISNGARTKHGEIPLTWQLP